MSCGGEVEESRYVLRVDQTLSPHARIRFPNDAIDDSHYLAVVPPRDRYEVVLRGDHATVAPLDGSWRPLSGERSVGTRGETIFDSEEGRLIIQGSRAELTFYGSGVPVTDSDRGTLVTP